MNIENHNKIIAKIEADPSCWNQKKWHCGTTHCYAGHAQIEAGQAPGGDVRRDARTFLDLNSWQADYAFCINRSLKELKRLPEYFAGLDNAYFDRFRRYSDGLDCDGLDHNNQPRQD